MCSIEPGVDLMQAWSWICPKCSQLNFVRGNECKDAAVLADAKEFFGGDGVLVLQPEKVFCCKCETRFNVNAPKDD